MEKNYFEIHKIALRIGGVSLREKETVLYQVYSALVLFLFLLYPFLGLNDVMKHDFDTTADLLTYEFPMFVAVAKVLAVRINRATIIRVLNRLDTENIFKNAENKEVETRMMKTCFLVIKLQTYVYWSFALFSYLFAVSYTLSRRLRSDDYRDWQFPYGKFTLFGADRSPNFELSWVYQSLAGGYLAIHFTTIDMLMISVLCQVCFKLKILQTFLKETVETSYRRRAKNHAEVAQSSNQENEGIQWPHLKQSLREVVEAHLAIIDSSKDIDHSFSILLLLVFSGTLLVLSFMVYKASFIQLTDVRFLRSVCEICIAVFEAFMMCFWSDLMKSEGEAVGQAAYETTFVGTDLKFQKGLVLLIRRSQTPITMTAGGFVDISLSTFTWIMRTTYSAYMVLRNHNAAENN